MRLINRLPSWPQPSACLMASILLAACGEYAGTPAGSASLNNGDNGNSEQPGNVSDGDAERFFEDNLKHEMDFCRTCHVPNGVADTDEGRRLLLSASGEDDYQRSYAAWEAMDRGVDSNLLLSMPAGTAERSHSGGEPWPPGSQQYADMRALLHCWDDPDNCGTSSADNGNNPEASADALLGSKRGGHVWADFCADQPDSAALPVDPRSLVETGVNGERHVLFNIEWRDCRADPDLVGERGHPETCGEYRELYAIGDRLMRGDGAIRAGNFFGGDAAESSGNPLDFTISAEEWNTMWMSWGLFSRPDDYDELLAQRYGTPINRTVRNPYPLPGEDPNSTNGGSGQLPAAFTHLRSDDGQWTGRIGLTCHGCHSGEVGTPADGEGLGLTYGSGNSLNDVAVVARDLGFAAQSPIGAFSLFGVSRGTNNASDVNIFALMEGFKPDPNAAGVLSSGSTGSMDTPAWWNLGHRPSKFIDGFFPGDSSRVDLIFYTPLGGDNEWVRAHAQAADIWATSLKSPAYPLAVDNSLASQGAVLFHSKDLWAEALNNPVPRPTGGNGSCASCHGVYSKHYTSDQRFLVDSRLEGVAGYITPIAIIGTDSARLDTNNEAVSQYTANTFLGFSETIGSEYDCGPQNRAEVRGDREPGYLTPPLHGIWATAPYLHNGSVPDLWGILDPNQRPEIWKRVSTPAPADAPFGVVMGFDTDLGRAYDAQRGGWKYEIPNCAGGSSSLLPLVDCDPVPITDDPVLQLALDQFYGNSIASWNVGNVRALLEFTPQQIEDRKIYNTNLYSQGNQGHAFTSVLTDAERRALIEYLKTL